MSASGSGPPAQGQALQQLDLPPDEKMMRKALNNLEEMCKRLQIVWSELDRRWSSTAGHKRRVSDKWREYVNGEEQKPTVRPTAWNDRVAETFGKGNL